MTHRRSRPGRLTRLLQATAGVRPVCISDALGPPCLSSIVRQGMTDSAYQELMQKAVAHMRCQNRDAWAKWSLENLPRFDWDQEHAQMTFSAEGKAAVVADIQFVGSWSERAGTWMWAWANESVMAPM